MFTFTPLLGAQSSASKASQSILELDGGVKILVDVGWDDTFDPLDLVELEKYEPPRSSLHTTCA
jgi:cleavage and polyadenylation specificity factor subunit 2